MATLLFQCPECGFGHHGRSPGRRDRDQAQHTLTTDPGKTGRYDGLYLSGGYPYVVLEAKRHAHDLDDSDFQQARSYATSDFFDKPVPYLVVSNGREHRFYHLTATINPADHKPIYVQIPAVDWGKIIIESPGEVKQRLTQAQLLTYLRTFKEQSYTDIASLFIDPATGKFDLDRHALGTDLGQIIEDRKNFIGVTAKGDAAIRHAIQAVALHFMIKILFIKLIEDLARGPETPRIIHTLFPNRDYDQIGGLFGFKVLNALETKDRRKAMRFMVDLAERHLARFRGHKIVEPACGSGHFYREIYRRYVAEVRAQSVKSGLTFDPSAAHVEALQHVYGRDIDPFAVQLTLLSTFLEQLKDNVRPGEGAGKARHRWLADRSIDTQNSLDPITIDPKLYFDIEKTADLTIARSRRASCERAAGPDLMIGNPPYGVAVVKGAHYDDVYSLSSSDSYGYFIVNAIKRLAEGKRIVFIVSSSFLTIGSHKPLRDVILSACKVIRIAKLHRQTFPGIDIFPAIVELERCGDAAQRAAHVYQFYDLWRLHPIDHRTELKPIYAAILGDLAATAKWPFDEVRAKRYTVRQGVLDRYSKRPIFEGLASLYEFMADVAPTAATVRLTRNDGSKIEVRFLTRNRLSKPTCLILAVRSTEFRLSCPP